MAKETDGKHADTVDTMQTRLPSLSIDYGLYAQYLDDSNLPEDQKREFIETLWSIILAFVDLGFGVHPAPSVCGQNSDNPDLHTQESGIVLGLDHSLSKTKTIEAASRSRNGHGTREES